MAALSCTLLIYPRWMGIDVDEETDTDAQDSRVTRSTCVGIGLASLSLAKER